ncbi:MAG: putative quinol monooxygenase [Sphingopyxis sp.]|jgi:quinol monooxygenase YgiN|uniref:putative quinol monooxygenase n=2 Tax=Sphingopyxis sp. TaxID=1908224 RepID=UPI00403768B6
MRLDSYMILITGHIILTPEHRERMIALGAEHSVRSRGEAGCLAHHCHVDVEDAMRLVFVEEWESIDAVRAHFAVPASAAFVAEMRALSPEAPVIRIYAAEDITAKQMG